MLVGGRPSGSKGKKGLDERRSLKIQKVHSGSLFLELRPAQTSGGKSIAKAEAHDEGSMWGIG